MKPETITLIWFITGCTLMLAELFVPGLVIVFLGIAALMVSFFLWAGVLSGIINSFIAWLFLSLLLVLFLRRFAVRLFPSESSYQLVEEDIDTIGTVVDVVETVHENDNKGRISFGGTTWPAISNHGTIEAGKKATLLYRDDISWVIEPCMEEENE